MLRTSRARSTANPSGEWTAQQARNFDRFLQDANLPCAILQRDQDTKYVQAFDDGFTGDGGTIKKTPIKSPNLAFVERVIQTLKHEVLNGFCVINEQHLDYLLKVGADWYNNRRFSPSNFPSFSKLKRVATFLNRAAIVKDDDATQVLLNAGVDKHRFTCHKFFDIAVTQLENKRTVNTNKGR